MITKVLIDGVLLEQYVIDKMNELLLTLRKNTCNK